MKVIKKAIRLVMILLVPCCITAVAQPVPVAPGTKVPDVPLGHVLNDPGRAETFAGFKDKLVILDFFHTTCSSCIAAFPKMNALQKQFNDKIRIILVTGNTEEEVNKTFAKLHPEVSNLTVVTNDITLNKLFPHLAEPHHAWIDPDGIYQFALFDHNTTEKNIKAYLAKKKLLIGRKNDSGAFDSNSLLSQANAFGKQVKSYSLFMKGLSEYTFSQSNQVINDSVTDWPHRFKGVNLTPLDLLQCAFDKDAYGYEMGLLNMKINTRLLIEVSNKEDLYIPRDADNIDAWTAGNRWSYEVMVEPRSADDLYRKMQADLNRVLPYNGFIENRKVKCLVLVRTDKKDHLKTAGSGKTNFIKDYYDFKNIPLPRLMAQMNYAGLTQIPIIDKSGIGYNIDYKISIRSFADLTAMRSELQTQGLDLVEREETIPMLVIKDNIARPALLKQEGILSSL